MATHLILDESSVAAHRGVTFKLNRATPHPENPVLEPGEPHQWDSLQVSWPSTVLYSERDRKFRCWYGGLDCIQTPDRTWLYGYAESDDGVHWVKPELPFVKFLDRPTNRIGLPEKALILSLVFENPDPRAPESRRFGAYWIEHAPHPETGQPYMLKVLGYSPDGQLWTRHGVAHDPKVKNRFGLHDINQLVFDPEHPDPQRRVIGYTQWMLPHDKPPFLRVIGMVFGETPEKLVQRDDLPHIALSPLPGVDEELHFATVTRMHGKRLMLFESDRFSRNPIDGDLRLAVSDDGVRFRRVHPTSALVDTGPKGTWNENLLVTVSGPIITRGDEHLIYFHGCPNVYKSWPAQYAVMPERRGSMFAPCYMGLATLPRDRFAYAEGPGEIELDVADASDLWVNADGALALTNGVTRGVLTDERRHRVYRRVRWESRPTAGRLTIRLRDGERVYSVASGG